MNPDLIKSSPWEAMDDKMKSTLIEIMEDDEAWNVISEHLRNDPEEPEMDVAVCVDDTGIDYLVMGGMYVFDQTADADFIKIEVEGEWREVFIDRFRFESI